MFFKKTTNEAMTAALLIIWIAAWQTHSLPLHTHLMQRALPRIFRPWVEFLATTRGLHPRATEKQANYLTCHGVSHVITHSLKMTRPLAQSLVTPDFYNIDPCWDCMDGYSDFIKRTSLVNSCGNANASVLLLSPMDSVFALAEGDVFDIDYNMLDVHGGIPKLTPLLEAQCPKLIGFTAMPYAP